VIQAQQDVSVMKTQAKAALETETLNVRSEMELLIKRQEGESLGQKYAFSATMGHPILVVVCLY
jgi:hypothetical protein